MFDEFLSLFKEFFQKIMTPFTKIFSFFKKFDEIAISRGRNPSRFRIITLFILIVFWLIGLNIGAFMPGGGFGTGIVFGFLSGILGVFIAYLIVKNSRKGDYVEARSISLENAKPLSIPCQIQITRKKIYYTWPFKYHIFLNGKDVGQLKNGKNMQISTTLKHNVISAIQSTELNGDHPSEVGPMYFLAEDGGMGEIFFNARKFLPEMCQKIQVLSAKDMRTAIGAPEGAIIYADYKDNKFPAKQLPPKAKTAAIINTLLGVLSCLIAIPSLLTTASPGGYDFFFSGLGIFFTIIGVIAIFQCFGRKTKARKPFLIYQSIIALITILIILFFIVFAILVS